MTKEEATEIKGEILKREGNVTVCNVIDIPNVVQIDDVLRIIDQHISGKENKK